MTKKGRPKKEKRKSHNLKIRLDDEEMEMLLNRSNDTGETYSDVIRKALKFYYFMREKQG